MDFLLYQCYITLSTEGSIDLCQEYTTKSSSSDVTMHYVKISCRKLAKSAKKDIGLQSTANVEKY